MTPKPISPDLQRAIDMRNAAIEQRNAAQNAIVELAAEAQDLRRQLQAEKAKNADLTVQIADQRKRVERRMGDDEREKCQGDGAARQVPRFPRPAAE